MAGVERRVVLVTGGTGLVGSAIREVVEKEGREGEEWVFLSSKVCGHCYLAFSWLCTVAKISLILTFSYSPGRQPVERGGDEGHI